AGWLRRVLLPGLWIGAAVLAKASGLVFGPLCLLVVEWERLARRGACTESFRLGSWRPFARDLAQLMTLGMVLVFVYCGSDWTVEPSFVAWAHHLPAGPTSRCMV